jgi:hypothetical protein
VSHAHGHGWESSRVRGPVGHSCLRVTTSERFFNLGSGAPASAVDHHNACHQTNRAFIRLHVNGSCYLPPAAISSAINKHSRSNTCACFIHAPRFVWPRCRTEQFSLDHELTVNYSLIQPRRCLSPLASCLPSPSFSHVPVNLSLLTLTRSLQANRYFLVLPTPPASLSCQHRYYGSRRPLVRRALGSPDYRCL